MTQRNGPQPREGIYMPLRGPAEPPNAPPGRASASLAADLRAGDRVLFVDDDADIYCYCEDGNGTRHAHCPWGPGLHVHYVADAGA
jgi:hypothetical protein